jgi:hypothetical protein
MPVEVQQPTANPSNDYFSCDMMESTLKDLVSGASVSTKVLSYFFDRLMYAYYSQFWFRDSTLKRVKIFKPQSLVTFFHYPKNTLNDSFFDKSLLNVYALMGKCIFT